MLLVLIAVSLLWAFSFGLIKGHLHGIDPSLVAALRLAAALIVFLPFLRPRGVSPRSLLRLAAIGGIQFGLVYILYLGAYPYLKAYEVALFTITTPLWVTLIEAGFARRWVWVHAVAALLSIAGAAVVSWSDWARGPDWATVKGFMMIQASNVCFAAGQIGWRWERRRIPKQHSDLSLIAVAYLGGLLVTGLFQFPSGAPITLSLDADQIWVILYLGTIATGLGFFLWNFAASRVDAGTLAVANNLKIPLAVAASLVVFGEHANLVRLLVSFALMAAGVVVAERSKPSAKP